MAVSERRFSAAVQSLVRIRSADKTEPDGTRTVWHQGADGMELLSFIDAAGFLERQDFTFFGEQIVWTRDFGVRTGAVVGDGGSRASGASDLLRLDGVVSHEKLASARGGLRHYDGEDRYVLHLREMLDRENAAAASAGGFMATRSDIAKVGGRFDPRWRRRVVAAAVIGAAALTAIAVALVAAR